MTKAMMLALVAFLVSAATASADFVEYLHLDGTPTLSFYGTGKVHGKLGWSAFLQVQKNWSEAFVGPTFAPAAWIELGASAGLETGGNRFAETLWLGHGPVSVLAVHEHGFSGPWHRVTADYAVAKGVTVGYHDQAFLGRGPRVSYTKGSVMAWASALIKGGKLHPVFSLRVSK